jgi:hypothetical protein
MKTKRDLYSFRIDRSLLHIIRFIELPLAELFVGGKYLAGNITSARRFHIPCDNSHTVVVPFNLIDWNLVWDKKKVYNFYYSIPFKDRRRYYK